MTWHMLAIILIWACIPLWAWLIWTAHKDRKQAHELLTDGRETATTPGTDVVAHVTLTQDGDQFDVLIQIDSDHDRRLVATLLHGAASQILMEETPTP